MASFFEEQMEQSKVKATIVAKYFWPWAKIVMQQTAQRYNKPRIAYIDLFCGPGRYKDGSKSTPLLILEKAVQDPQMCQQLLSYFNDADAENIESLGGAIAQIEGIENLATKPKIVSGEIDGKVAEEIASANLVPSLFFVDPWGYKGLSNDLVNAILKDWGSECIVFFNYTRVNMGLPNARVTEHMNKLFGEQRAEELRKSLIGASPEDRELAIVEAYCDVLSNKGSRYVLPFRFKRPDGSRTSHHLVHVTKHVRGYEIMKGVMANESSGDIDGVPTFEYNPAFGKQGLLFELSRPLEDLGGMLCSEFHGKTLTVQSVYDSHHVNRRFIKANYKECLRRLAADGRVIFKRPNGKAIRQNTLPDDVEVTFI